MTTTRNRNVACRSLARSVVAELVGDRHADAACEALAWECRRVGRRAAVLALHATLFTLAALAVACRAALACGHAGTLAALSLCRRHYPAVRSAAVAAATLAAKRAAAAVVWLLATAAALWDVKTLDRVNGLVADALERGVIVGRWLWDAARGQPARVAAVALAGSVAVLALLVALWDAAR
jgi:hypothetical protein